jgi:hypothetical protein
MPSSFRSPLDSAPSPCHAAHSACAPANVIRLSFTHASEPVLVLCQVATATARVTLHSNDIVIQTAGWAATADGAVTSSTSIEYDEKNETATLVFPAPLPVGSVVLSINFVGALNDKVRLHRVPHQKNEKNEHHHHACLLARLLTSCSFPPMQMAGFYRSKYTNAAGEEKYAAVTQVRRQSAAAPPGHRVIHVCGGVTTQE